MKARLLVLFLTVLAAVVGTSPAIMAVKPVDGLTGRDLAVMTAAVPACVPPDLAGRVEAEKPYIILRDATVPVVFPPSAGQSRRESELTSHPELVPEGFDWFSVWEGHPDPDKPHVLEDGATIAPRMIQDLIARSSRSVTVPAISSPVVPLMTERHRWLARTFGSPDGARAAEFKAKHPAARGVLSFSRPGYDEDEELAGLNCSLFRIGVGAAEWFVVLKRESGDWKVAWRALILLE